MKLPNILPLILCLSVTPLTAAEESAAERAANTVILNETGIRNLQLETELIEESSFDESIFALGRIAVLPGKRAVVSSRIPGRAVDVLIKQDHPVEKGDVAVVVESRQPGNPPPLVEINAPISGLVSATHVVIGEPVEPDKVLAEILDLDEVYALARVPEHLAGKLERGQSARITVPAVPGKVFEARIEHLGVEADAGSGTLEAAFRVANPGHELRPGMRAEFSIVVGSREGVFSVPRSALQGDAANRFVYVKDFELPNAFVKTPVVVGRVTDRRAEILSGLFPADEVVTRGAYSLAFAGGNTLSLKEALDAAHGHEHAEDGSELKDAGKPGSSQSTNHGDHSNMFWMAVSAVLFVLLIVVAFGKKGGPRAE